MALLAGTSVGGMMEQLSVIAAAPDAAGREPQYDALAAMLQEHK